MTPEDIMQAYEDAGVRATREIIAGAKQAIERVEQRIEEAYETLLPAAAHEKTKNDRVLLKAQLTFLANLEEKK